MHKTLCRLFSLWLALGLATSLTSNYTASADEPSTDQAKTPYSTLSEEDKAILDSGEISNDTQLVSGLVGTFVGFGLGQAIQHRYWPTGALITVGEAASFGVLIAGLANCANNSTLFQNTNGTLCGKSDGLITAGALGYLAFRIWEVLDVWIAPSVVNRHYWNVRDRTEGSAGARFIALPVADVKTGAVNGGKLALQYNF
jgi:hypothetical protein